MTVLLSGKDTYLKNISVAIQNNTTVKANTNSIINDIAKCKNTVVQEIEELVASLGQ